MCFSFIAFKKRKHSGATQLPISLGKAACATLSEQP
jgi:hypothetical protein